MLRRRRDLTRFEQKLTSQNGEDGVIAEILRRIGVGPAGGWFVEFGAGTGEEGNCVQLADVAGWSGLFIECDPVYAARLAAKYAESARVRVIEAAVRADNVEVLFASAGVPPEPDVLSIDIDGNDWWIWREIRTYRPRLVVVEYNANLDVSAAVTLTKPYRPDGAWDETAWFGASLGAYELLAGAKGYRLVHTDTRGVNAFFVRDDLLEHFRDIVPPRRRANYDGRGLGMPGDVAGMEWVDVRTVDVSA